MKQRSAVARNRKARAFLSGFATGLSAPLMLFAGSFEVPTQVRRTSVEGSWNKASAYIRNAARRGELEVEGDERERA